MISGRELITPPASEPITLSEIKNHARIDQTLDDALLNGFITAARCWVEQRTHSALLTQTWRIWLDAWPLDCDCISLPIAPAQSIANITLYNADGSSNVWDSEAYQLDNATNPPRLILKQSQAWPTLARTRQGVSLTYYAGYSNAATVPEPLKLAIKQLVTHWYDQRGEAGTVQQEVPFGVSALIAPYRRVQL